MISWIKFYCPRMYMNSHPPSFMVHQMDPSQLAITPTDYVFGMHLIGCGPELFVIKEKGRRYVVCILSAGLKLYKLSFLISDAVWWYTDNADCRFFLPQEVACHCCWWIEFELQLLSYTILKSTRQFLHGLCLFEVYILTAWLQNWSVQRNQPTICDWWFHELSTTEGSVAIIAALK